MDPLREVIAQITRRQVLRRATAVGTAIVANGQSAAGEAALTPTSVKASAYAASPGDFVPVDVSVAWVEIALPAAPVDQARVGVKAIAITVPYVVTVVCGGSDALNEVGGPTSLTLDSLNECALLQYQASTGIWYVQAGVLSLDVPGGAAKLGTDGTVGGPSGSGLSKPVANASSAVAFPESYGAVGDGITDDTAALLAWGKSGSKNLQLTPGKTYLHRQTLLQSVPSGTVLDGNGATLMRVPQAVTTTTTTIVSGVTDAIIVAATSGGSGASAWSLEVDDEIVVQQGSATNFDQRARTITSIAGSVVTISGTFGVSLSGTVNVYGAWNQVLPQQPNVTITNTVLDGNSSNWSWGRWQHTVAVQNFIGANFLKVHHCRIINQYGDALSGEAVGCEFAFNDVENIAGRGIVFAGTAGAAPNQDTRCIFNRFINCNSDTNVAGGDGVGSLDFSQGGPNTLIHGNYVDGGVDGVGALLSVNGGDVTITGNEFWNLTGKAINAAGSGVGAPSQVIISHNRLYGCGFTVNNAGVPQSWTIADNIIVGAASAIQYIRNSSVNGNKFVLGALSPPAGLVATAAAGGGTFSGGTFYYVVTASNSAGETTGSGEASATVASNGTITLTWTLVPGATSYRIYRATSSGGEISGSTLIATIASATTAGYVDTGTPATAGAAPSSNTTHLTTVAALAIGRTGGDVKGLTVSGNHFVGGSWAIELYGGCAGLLIAGNLLTSQYSGGITETVSTNTNVAVKHNTVLNDTTSNKGYEGIVCQGVDEIVGNTLDVSGSGTTAYGVVVTAGSPSIRDNFVKGGGQATVQVNSPATSATVVNNQMDHYLSDSGTTTRKQGNTYTFTGALNGAATLLGGTTTVSTSEIRAGDKVLLTVSAPGGALGFLSYGMITPSKSFVITSSSLTDTSTVAWQIMH